MTGMRESKLREEYGRPVIGSELLRYDFRRRWCTEEEEEEENNNDNFPEDSHVGFPVV